jgi:hypothetical protein
LHHIDKMRDIIWRQLRSGQRQLRRRRRLEHFQLVRW